MVGRSLVGGEALLGGGLEFLRFAMFRLLRGVVRESESEEWQEGLDLFKSRPCFVCLGEGRFCR
jgi:hypothetical protein